MFCSQCGAKNEDNSNFCLNCGAKIENVSNEGIVSIEESGVKKTKDLTSKSKQSSNKSGLRKLKIGGAIASLLIVALVVTAVLFPLGGGKELGIIYEKNDDLYILQGNGEVQELSDDEYGWVIFNKEGNYIYYLDNYDEDDRDGDLYLKEKGKEKVKILSGANLDFLSLVVSQSGRRIMFIKDYEYQDFSGELYLSVDGNKPEKIADNARNYGFVFGENEEEILFVEEEDLYYKKEGKNKEKIDEEVDFPLLLRENGKEIVYAKNHKRNEIINTTTYDIYRKLANDEPERISKDTVLYLYNKDYSKSTQVTIKEDKAKLLLTNKENEEVEIDRDITAFYSMNGLQANGEIYNEFLRYSIIGRNYYLANCYISERFKVSREDGYYEHTKDVLQKTENIESFFTVYTEDNDDVYVYKEGYEPQKISDYEYFKPDFYNYIRTNEDYTTLVYLETEDGEYVLYIRNFENGEFSEAKEIDTDNFIRSLSISKDGSTVAYLKDAETKTMKEERRKLLGIGKLYISVEGEKPKKIAGEVPHDYKLSDDGKSVVYIDEDNDLYYIEIGKDKEKIASDVRYFETMDFETIYYISAYDKEDGGELYKWKVGNKAVKIDDDVSNFYLLGDIY